MKKIWKIDNVIFNVDEGAKPFVSKLQSLLTSENSEMMLAQSRELLFKSIYEPGFANSFKIFLQTAYWYNDLTEYEDSPDYGTPETNLNLKGVELLGQYKGLDRRVCFAGFILNQIAGVIFLDNWKCLDMDSEELQMHFVNNLRDFDFLSNRNAEMWFDLQGGYSYDDNALPDEEELEETLYNPLQRQGGEQAVDFNYSSLNYAIVQGSEEAGDCMASGWLELAGATDDVFNHRVMQAHQQIINENRVTVNDLEATLVNNDYLETNNDSVGVDIQPDERITAILDELGTSPEHRLRVDVDFGENIDIAAILDDLRLEANSTNDQPQLRNNSSLLPGSHEFNGNNDPLLFNETYANETEDLVELGFLCKEGVLNTSNYTLKVLDESDLGWFSFSMKFGKVIYTLYKFRHFFVGKYKIWRNRK